MSEITYVESPSNQQPTDATDNHNSSLQWLPPSPQPTRLFSFSIQTKSTPSLQSYLRDTATVIVVQPLSYGVYKGKPHDYVYYSFLLKMRSQDSYFSKIIAKRYSEFKRLHYYIYQNCKNQALPSLGEEKWWFAGGNKREFQDMRFKTLNNWMKALLSHYDLRQQACVIGFLQ